MTLLASAPAKLLMGCLTAFGFGCGLAERDDFMVGRRCEPESAEACDDEQQCLPHAYTGGRPTDFRCRDVDSFQIAPNGQEPPLAFCAPEDGLICPGNLICNAGRIRMDSGARRRICKLPDSRFGPPLDAGSIDGGG